MGEFDLIERFFKPAAAQPGAAAQIALGIGDDCALLQPGAGMQLAVSSDMLVQGRHFFADADPVALGHKALAVNLSDLAAMGARPLCFTLALALPAADECWLAGFSNGLLALARQHQCPLVGGDTTRGPLNICICVLGEVPAGQALRRSGAQVDDDIWVSGTLGDARLALQALQGQCALPAPVLAQARQRLDRPTPRVALGQALRGIASSAIDLSDGLAADLRHVLRASDVGAVLDATALANLLAVGASTFAASDLPDAPTCLSLALTGGDDYELLFTAAPARQADILAAARTAQTPVTRVGHVVAERGLWQTGPHGARTPVDARGFDHFG
ncbi:MAG: thiamine-phosphate kinase [Burkholderiaceae bacterium]|nr:thiamine-phosphate kinase [Burkholderiaceae bacterium]